MIKCPICKTPLGTQDLLYVRGMPLIIHGDPVCSEAECQEKALAMQTAAKAKELGIPFQLRLPIGSDP